MPDVGGKPRLSWELIAKLLDPIEWPFLLASALRTEEPPEETRPEGEPEAVLTPDSEERVAALARFDEIREEWRRGTISFDEFRRRAAPLEPLLRPAGVAGGPSRTRSGGGNSEALVLILMLVILVGSYPAWVLIAAWVVQLALGNPPVSTGFWLVTLVVATIAGAGSYKLLRKVGQDGLTTPALIGIPIVLEVVAFGLLRGS